MQWFKKLTSCKHLDWAELERFYDEDRNLTTIRFVCNVCNYSWNEVYAGVKEEKKDE
jgi:hypothetical protein